MSPRCGRAQTSPTRSVIPSVRDRGVPLTTRRPTLGKDESRMVGSTLRKKSVGEGEGWKMMQLKQSTLQTGECPSPFSSFNFQLVNLPSLDSRVGTLPYSKRVTVLSTAAPQKD